MRSAIVNTRRTLIYGVGINDVFIPKFSKTICYKKWTDVLRRCHSEEYKKQFPYYKEANLDPRWHYLSAFKEWIETWDDYENKAIDKDIKFPDNNTYGPDTCLMVSKQINNWFKPTDIIGSHGDLSLPRGVSARYGKYRAQINILSTGQMGKHLGFYDTPEEAAKVYEAARKEQIEYLIEQQSDVRLVNALQQYL